MDCINDPRVKTIVFMKSSQVGASESIVNIVGYFVDYDPSPILCIQPTADMAATFSKDRITPLFRDTYVLRNKLSDKVRSKGAFDVNNTIAHKVFPGGHLSIIGANSPTQLASRPIRVLLIDEVDRFKESARH